MPRSPSPLPARPSLEQLRKQAKDLLRAFRAGDGDARERFRTAHPRSPDPSRSQQVTLADAQVVLAREYGFESWPGLVHHVQGLQEAAGLEQHERLAGDLVLAYHSGDPAAIHRLNDLLHSSFDLAQVREFVEKRLGALPDAQPRPADFGLDGARLLVARIYGFGDWASLAESSRQPPSDPRSAPHGLSTTPPFYRIDWESRTIEPRQPMSGKDWERLIAVMQGERLTGLNARGQVTDEVLGRVSKLAHVTTLQLGGCQQLTDEGLRHLARMPQLEELALSEYPGGVLSDRGLEVLRELPELRRFAMCHQQGISDAGAANLAFCAKLERVDLMGTPTGDGAIEALTGKPGLRHFKAGGRVSVAGLASLHAFPAFKTWQGGDATYGLMEFEAGPTYLLLNPKPFTHGGLDRLAGLDGLFALNVDGPVALTAAGLEPLLDLPNLGWLGVDPTDEAMRQVASLPSLRVLMCQDTGAGDDGFAQLSRSPTVEYIWGRRCHGLTGRGFAALAAMPALRGLSVSCKNVDDRALASLPRFRALAELMPMDVPDEGFRHVGRCEGLEALWCMYCRDTGDAATAHIAGLPRLRTYYAGRTRISDRSLEILGRMTSLEAVELWETAGVTNAGVAHLVHLPRLRKLVIEGVPGVTREVLGGFPARVRVSYSAS